MKEDMRKLNITEDMAEDRQNSGASNPRSRKLGTINKHDDDDNDNDNEQDSKHPQLSKYCHLFNKS